ncbi:synaptotagmin-like protein 4 isoform X1 [Oryzias melastigma]|uniref:Synaptotagmin-like protein 4 n=1 Tax=Oryzias melastigma TaxID=30732 RepID=A0A3B3C7R0_ORYME|nr:synaptotagmin-like protein 4 isoform X1 [Oryzias melastigma]XP_024139698.1 synaptotagmin-like protein 4 isoform X1 [Oryzias melastigma]XP_036069725.1 synaptotagmin-like protein 4 isoform X1 [Oryzias melastigma]
MTLEMINLSFLSELEQQMILEVLKRDEELRLIEDKRVRKLKTELLDVKRKGAKRSSGNYSERSCGRCQEPLSRLAVFPSQCKMCKHNVCRNCQAVLPDGSRLCSVCVKESDVKKRTGDWFYDQRVNRFSMTPAHDLVRASLRKRHQIKKRVTTGELLLESTEKNLDPPKPVPVPRQKKMNKSSSSETLESIASRESSESKSSVSSKTSFSSKPTRSDTESAENHSETSTRTNTEPSCVTPEETGELQRSNSSSPTPSSAPSLSVPVKADVVSTDGGNSNSLAAVKGKAVSQSPELDVEKLFKKSIRRPEKPAEFGSTVDLWDGCQTSEPSMGSRSRSVPGLDLQEIEEEEEDIDTLVNIHKSQMTKSHSDLYNSKSTLGSMMSIYSDAGDYGTVEVSGQVVFSLRYDEHTQSLQVFIKECQDLAYGDASRKLSNPYVKCYLLHDKTRQSKKKTSIKKNTIHPIFSETLKYSISRSELLNQSVSISVWHHGRLSRNVFLGEVMVPLDSRNLDSPLEECWHLTGKTSSDVPATAFEQYSGELVISLKYVTPNKSTTEKVKGKKAAKVQGGELHVLIKEAKNLKSGKSGSTTDSFVKGHLFPSKAKTTKMKTPVVKKNLNPHYDTIFVYNELTLEQLKEVCLELTVWDKEAVLNNELLGGVRLSSGNGAIKVGKTEVELDSVGEEVSLWQKMMQYPDSWAEGTLPLRSTMAKMAKIKGK